MPNRPSRTAVTQHVAQSCRQRRLSPAVGRFARHGEELGVIVKFELHGRTLHGAARRVGDRHGERSACGIVRNHVDFGVVGRGFHHLLRAVVITEDLGVHQHPAAGRGVEPPQVEHRFRLAGPEEMPPSVGPGLDPGVVVVGVRPAGRVDLPGRDAHRAQRSDEQRRLLAAAAVGRAHGGQRRTGPRIRRLVVGLFVTPVVHFEDGVVHRQPFDARRQLVVEHPARIVEVLVVHPARAARNAGTVRRKRCLPTAFPGGWPARCARFPDKNRPGSRSCPPRAYRHKGTSWPRAPAASSVRRISRTDRPGQAVPVCDGNRSPRAA